LRRKEWDQAADDFARMIQRHPGYAMIVERAYAEAGAGERASEFYARLLRLRPDDMQVRHNAGLLPAWFSRWTEAAGEYAALIERKPGADADTWFEHACLRLLTGDRDGYRKVADLMLKRGEEKKDLRPYLVARACALAPLPAEDVKRAARLAEAELAQNGQAHWSLLLRGALEVRAGQPDRAVPLLHQALKPASNWEGIVLVRLWLALALHAQGKEEDARTELGAAVETLDRWGKEMPTTVNLGTTPLHVHDWMEAQILRREAEAVIARKKADAPK
jgi:tetratricopeptide (TPR) repeat protein